MSFVIYLFILLKMSLPIVAEYQDSSWMDEDSGEIDRQFSPIHHKSSVLVNGQKGGWEETGGRSRKSFAMVTVKLVSETARLPYPKGHLFLKSALPALTSI